MGKVRFDEQTTPATPPTGFVEVYVDSADKKAKSIDDAGLILDLTFGGMGVPLSLVGDEVYLTDPTRSSKKLGLSLLQLTFANDKQSTNRYLETLDGIPCNVSSHHLPYDATLVAIEMTEELNNQTWTAEVRRNGSVTVLDSLQIVNAFTNSSINNDTDFASGDIIQVFLNGMNIEKAHVTVYFRRRTP